MYSKIYPTDSADKDHYYKVKRKQYFYVKLWVSYGSDPTTDNTL